MSRTKIATLVMEEEAEIEDYHLLIDNRLEAFNDTIKCVSNEDGTYDVLRVD